MMYVQSPGVPSVAGLPGSTGKPHVWMTIAGQKLGRRTYLGR